MGFNVTPIQTSSELPRQLSISIQTAVHSAIRLLNFCTLFAAERSDALDLGKETPQQC